MERVGKTLKKQSFRKIVTYFLVYCMVMNTSLPAVLATPSGGSFTHGTGSFNYVAGGDTTVTVDQSQSIIEWGAPGSGGIDTSSAESLSFLQASGLSNSAVLNRIMSGNPTLFDGTLNGLDMRIFIVNPAGVVFGDGATINVTQLVASGLGMSDPDFLNATGNAAKKMIFSGGSGDVNINGTLDATNTGSLYLVGKNVYNNGSILCPGGLVVMAAGETLKLGQPGSSVVVDLADFTFATNNLNTSGNVDAQHIVLGAGDIWASALTATGVGAASVVAKAQNDITIKGGEILADATAGSDAVTKINIIAGGDVYINDDVTTTAFGNGVDDATATVKIEAGGSVEITDSEVWSYARDGATNKAQFDITANDGHVEFVNTYNDSDNDEIGAWTWRGVDNISNVNITAKSQDVANPDKAYVLVEATNDARVDLASVAQDASNSNSTTLTINADGYVEINAQDSSEAWVEAVSNNSGEFSPTNDADITVNAGTCIDITAYTDSDAEIYAEASKGVDNTATVNVTANDGYVDVYADDYSDAGIEAYAYYAGHNNTADVAVTAKRTDPQDYGSGNVYVIAEDDGEAWIYAEAAGAGNKNSATATIKADGDVEVYANYYGDAYIETYASNGGTSNTTKTTVKAGGDVYVDAEYDGYAGIYAEASSSYDNKATVNVTANDGNVDVYAYGDSYAEIEAEAYYAENNNTANVTIAAKRTDPVDYKSGNVYVTSQDDSEASIYAEASEGVTNNAGVDITAGRDVCVHADGYGLYSFAGIEAEVYTGDETNTAATTVNAGEKVIAQADSGGEVDIDSEAWYSNTNKATTTINAGDHVELMAVGMGVDDQDQPLASDAAIEAEAWDGYKNTAEVDITVTGETGDSYSGMVRVIAQGGGQAEIEALSWNDGDVDDYTDLTPVGSDLEGTIEGITNKAKVDIEAKSVEVSADGVNSSAFISSNAGNEIHLNLYYTGYLDLTLGSISNNADISITTVPDDDGDMEGPVADNGDVLVVTSNGGIAGLDTEASNFIDAENDYIYTDLIVQGPVENKSDILINAGDDVITSAIDGGYSEIDSEAWNEIGGTYAYYINLIEQGPVQNSAGVDITTGGDVEVVSSFVSYANIGSSAWNGSPVLPQVFPDTKDNIATVDIDAGGGVDVIADYSSTARIGAEAEFATTNTSSVSINAACPVEVRAYQGSQADIMASTQLAVNSNTSDIEINAEHVAVSADDSSAAISAGAFSAYEEGSENTADVAIYTHAADVECDEQSGDVIVEAAMNGGAAIQAMTNDAYTNTSDVLICADSDVQVYGTMYGNADILAEATNAYCNTSSVGIAARGDEGVEVRADFDGRAYIESRVYSGYENTAETVVCTKGGVQVVDKSQVVASAGIIAEALYGNYNDAYVGVRAEDDIMVMAGIGPEDLEYLGGSGTYVPTGGHAEIRAVASSGEAMESNAETVVYSINGGVAVMDATWIEVPQPSGTAEIISIAEGSLTNTAYTGVYAGGDLLDEGHPLYDENQRIGVAVFGLGDFSEARITSETQYGYTNTSNTVVCTPAEVLVDAESMVDSIAEISSLAKGDYGFNTATTQVYASNVRVYNSSDYGHGSISANAFGWPYVPFVGDLEFNLKEYDGQYGHHDLVWVEGGGEVDDDIATLKIRDYSKRQDCPEAPKCPCEEQIGPKPVEPASQPFIQAAPIPEMVVLEISGYPALLSWVAKELGVEPENIQIGVANSLASSKGIQPYNSFSRLKKAAAILRDAGGVYINALAQVISEFASSTVPPTEEQMAAIANAISSNAGANNQYALAGQYLDALAEYVSILRNEMGFSADDAVRLATNNYIQNLTEGQTGVAAYMAARLAAMGG